MTNPNKLDYENNIISDSNNVSTVIIPNKLNYGDTIGIVAPSNPIIGENIEEIKKAKKIVENTGFKIKFSKNLFENKNGYSNTAREKAEDINKMFQDKEIKMIWCAKRR